MSIKVQGMSLLEVIIALVITAIIGIGLSQMAFFSAQNYQYNRSTSEVTAQANFIEAKLSRAIRHSVPNEFRILESTNYICLEATPIRFRGILNLYGKTKTLKLNGKTSLSVQALKTHKESQTGATYHLIIPAANPDGSSRKMNIKTIKANQVILTEPIVIDTGSEHKACYIALNPVNFCIIPSQNLQGTDRLVQCNHDIQKDNPPSVKQCTILGTNIVDSQGNSFFKSQSKPFINIDKQDYQSNQIRFELGLKYESVGVPSTYLFGNQLTLDNH